ncbi:MAG: hypothetical protein AAFY41_14100, partial [Bacteroidota bacterium]
MKPIQKFLVTGYKEFVQQFRLVILDEIRISNQERSVFENILSELTNQGILKQDEVDLNAYGYCEIRRINSQYAFRSTSSCFKIPWFVNSDKIFS